MKDENLDPRPKTDIQESQAIPDGMQGLESQVTGSLWKWMVKPGDAVECGQKLGIIESMKMETFGISDNWHNSLIT